MRNFILIGVIVLASRTLPALCDADDMWPHVVTVGPSLLREGWEHSFFVAGGSSSSLPQSAQVQVVVAITGESEEYSSEKVNISEGSSSAKVSVDFSSMKPRKGNARVVPATMRAVVCGDDGCTSTIPADVSIQRSDAGVAPGLTMLETDKGVYKPGETIRVRVITLTADLMPRPEKVTLELKNPEGTIVERQEVGSTGEYGVFSTTVELASKPLIGEYTLIVSDGVSKEATQALSVEEYVLPRFGVELQADDPIASDAGKVTGTAVAMYTFGKPVASAPVVVSLIQNDQVMYSAKGTTNEEGVYAFSIDVEHCAGYSHWRGWQGFPEDRRALRVAPPDHDGGSTCLRHSWWSGSESFITVSASVQDAASGEKVDADLQVALDPWDGDGNEDEDAEEEKVELEYMGALLQSGPKRVLVRTASVQKSMWYSYEAAFRGKVGVKPAKQYYDSKCFKARKSIYKSNCPGGKSFQANSKCRLDFKGREAVIDLEEIIKNDAEVSNDCEVDFISVSLYAGDTWEISKQETWHFLPSESDPSIAITAEAASTDAFEFKLSLSGFSPYTTRVRWAVFARGNVRDAGSVDAASQDEDVTSIRVDWNPSLSGQGVHFVAFAQHADRFVASSIDISNETLQFAYDVSTGFLGDLSGSVLNAAPGEAINIRAQTSKNPVKVWMLAVDEAAKLLAPSQEPLGSTTIEATLEPFTDIDHSCKRPGALDALASAGMAVSMSKAMQASKCADDRDGIPPPPDFGGGGDIVIMEMADMARSAPAPTSDKYSDAAESPEEPESGARTHFPESWIWEDFTMNAPAKILTRTAPDQITTYSLSSFFVSKDHGLSLAPDIARLVVFKPFFVDVHLPYSAVRGETLHMIAVVHSYDGEGVNATVSLNIDADEADIIGSSKMSVLVGKQTSTARVAFRLRPKTVGKVDIRVSAAGSGAKSDIVIRKLRVVPEGQEYRIVKNAILDIDGGSEAFNLDISVPAGLPVVEGSAHASVAASGSAMTQTLENVERLVQQPHGCGEQNILVMAPCVFALDYLDTLGKAMPEFKEKALRFVKTGYQREETYRHKNTDPGSFSAFGDSDGRGSVWLSALVLKVYAKASRHVFIDPLKMHETASWIASTQLKDGSFKETGRVIHSEMQSDSSKGHALTAFIVICLAEAQKSMSLLSSDDSISSSIDKAVAYLNSIPARKPQEQFIFAGKQLENSYFDALRLYANALTQTDSPPVSDVLSAVLTNAGVSWSETPASTEAKACKSYYNCGTLASEIEINGYILLATIVMSKSGTLPEEALSRAKWLLSKRSDRGGFYSTQDTLIGLQSLSEYSAAFMFRSTDLQLDLDLAGDNFAFTVDDSNKDVLQLNEFSRDTSSKVVSTQNALTGTVSGSGFAVVQATLIYNVLSVVDSDEDEDNGAAYAVECDWKDDAVFVKAACEGDRCDEMALVKCGLFTGYRPDEKSLDDVVKDPASPLMLVETDDREIFFYLHSVTNPAQFSFQVSSDYMVDDVKAVNNYAMSYYRPHVSSRSLSEFNRAAVHPESETNIVLIAIAGSVGAAVFIFIAVSAAIKARKRYTVASKELPEDDDYVEGESPSETRKVVAVS